MVTFRSEVLDDLCSQERLNLLDSIDSLRSQGIDHYVSLPQIIVCGDQSSGKSSVLEAISGVAFPVKSNLCTRFPIELVLRRTSHVGARVSIVPHHSRIEAEKDALLGFHEKLDNLEGLATLIDSAKVAMGISKHGKAFAKDLLRIEISGPDRPHLTIVDLPGLIHSQTKNQTASDVQLIQEVVESYMKEPRSIILAVISAKNDFANQIVLKLARTADPAGKRTLGVITKPDTLHSGSESEALFVSLARNQEVEFRLGWHILRNQDGEAGHTTIDQRDALEKEFFEQGVWPELPHNSLGIDHLRKRLSKVLLNHIATELPSLIADIELKRTGCDNELKKLGRPRLTLDDQKLHLLGIAESFQILVRHAVEGNWNDLFFTVTEPEEGYTRRLRAVIQNQNRKFTETLSAAGHRRHVADPKKPVENGANDLTRDEFIEYIQTKMNKSRGRELPGLFDPMIVADLFREQVGPWKGLAYQHVNHLWKACKVFLQNVVEYVADHGTATALSQTIIGPSMDTLWEALMARLNETLKPHYRSHPITYNHYFTETIQKIRADRIRRECGEAVKSFFGVSSLTPHHNVSSRGYIDLSLLVDAITRGASEPSMERFAASEALDNMDAYYKVALKRFVDDVAVEVVEMCLVSALSDILTPMKVFKMESDIVASIAGESEENRSKREQLIRQLQALDSGLATCKHFAVVNLTSNDIDVVALEMEELVGGRFNSSDPGSNTPPEELSTAAVNDAKTKDNDSQSTSEPLWGASGVGSPYTVDHVFMEQHLDVEHWAIEPASQGFGEHVESDTWGRRKNKKKKTARSLFE